MKALILSSLALMACVVDASAIRDGLLEARNPVYVSPKYTSTTSTTTTYTSTSCTTSTSTDTLTTTAYVTPHCSGTITWVTTVVAPPSKTYIVGTTYFYEHHSVEYFVSGTFTYSTTEAIITSHTYVPGPPGPGPKTATAPSTARQLNTLPSPCVAIIETKTLTYEPEVQTQVYLKNTVETVFAWTATTGTETLESLTTSSTVTTVNVYTGTTTTLPYTQPVIPTLHVTNAPPAEPTTSSTVIAAPVPANTTVVATTTAPPPIATGAAASKAIEAGMAVLVVGLGVILGL